MPITVEKVIKAREVRVGDEVRFPGKHFTELVDDVDPKRIYTEISTDYGTKRIELTAEVTVWRDEPTEEEAEQERREYIERFIRTSMTSAAENVIRTREQLIDSLDMRSASWHGSRWESFTNAQATEAIWKKVVQVAVGREVGLFDAMLIVRDSLTAELIQDLRLISRSTHQVSNLADDIVRDAQAHWLRNLEYVIL